MKILSAISLGVALSGAAAAAGPLLDSIEQADVIVIGQAEPGSQKPGGVFSLMIARVLKGSVTAPSVPVTVMPDSRPPSMAAIEPRCGIFFLRKSGDQFVVVRPAGQTVSSDGMYMPTDRCSSSGANETDAAAASGRVIREIIHGLGATAADPVLAFRLFSSVGLVESPDVAAASVELSGSASTPLRLLGLAWRIAEGDPAAIQKLVKESRAVEVNSPLTVMLRSAIAAYANGDPDGVEALGAIAAMNGGLLEQPVSEAFRSIHTRECLKHALRLLGSGDARVRENAIATFGMFVLEVPLLNEANRQSALERALNPATRKKVDPDTMAHILFGRPPNAAQEAEVAQWWKEWYARTFADASDGPARSGSR